MQREQLEKLQRKLQEDLPGTDSHQKMMRNRRISAEVAKKGDTNPRLSAVLIALYPEGDQFHTVFIRRNEYKGVHSKQVSFPGGKMEDTDRDLYHTALREAEEETGIISNDVEIIGELTEVYIPPSNFLVLPVVGVLKEKPLFVPDPIEVNRIITSPVNRIMERNVIQETEVNVDRYNLPLKVKYFDIDNEVVWGATAMMLSEFRDVLLKL